MVRLGLLWKPVVKGGTYPRGYFRVRGVARSSEKVKAVNRAFTAAAKECAGLPLKKFNQCIAEKLSGRKFGGGGGKE